MKKIVVLFLLVSLVACGTQTEDKKKNLYMDKVNQFASFTLSSDISDLSDSQKEMLKLFFEAADIMNELFWIEAYGDPTPLLDTIKDESLKSFIRINYGPWERLEGNASFVKGIGPKPAGANFYPSDMTKEEYDAWDNPEKNDQYSLIRRNNEGELIVVPYHEAFREQVTRASELLKKAAVLAEDEGFRKYLLLRAEALLTDNYQASDMA
ncbi:MAG: hypothetical protein JW801_12710 [Bacteroidales bacterium]|nr:hypothetical protein [Bacteroidales bacterium]